MRETTALDRGDKKMKKILVIFRSGMVYLMAVWSAESCCRECAKHIREERVQRQGSLCLWDRRGHVEGGEEWNGWQGQEKQWSMCQVLGADGWELKVFQWLDQVLKGGAGKLGFGIKHSRGITEDCWGREVTWVNFCLRNIFFGKWDEWVETDGREAG